MNPSYVTDKHAVISLQGIRYATISEDQRSIEISYKHQTKTIFYENSGDCRQTFETIKGHLDPPAPQFVPGAIKE